MDRTAATPWFPALTRHILQRPLLLFRASQSLEALAALQAAPSGGSGARPRPPIYSNPPNRIHPCWIHRPQPPLSCTNAGVLEFDEIQPFSDRYFAPIGEQISALS